MCEIISYNIHEKKRFYRNQFWPKIPEIV
jgi:hypothetical protein